MYSTDQLEPSVLHIPTPDPLSQGTGDPSLGLSAMELAACSPPCWQPLGPGLTQASGEVVSR